MNNKKTNEVFVKKIPYKTYKIQIEIIIQYFQFCSLFFNISVILSLKRCKCKMKAKYEVINSILLSVLKILNKVKERVEISNGNKDNGDVDIYNNKII